MFTLIWGLELQKISKISLLSLSALLFSCGAKDINTTRTLRKTIAIDFNAHHVFLVPHPDDWQLFMGEYAYDVIRSASTKVTIVLTNAGDAGKGTTYWQARELASLASVRASLGYPLVQGDPSETDETLSLNGKNIRHHTLRNVSMYFIRLPDGFPDGSGSSASNGESMLKLRDGDISKITTIDKANTFTWSELQTLMKNIVAREVPAPAQPLTFYIQDPGSEKKFSHSDHLATQDLARYTTGFYVSDQCKQIAFEDYRIKNKTENLGDAGKKSVLFSAYDVIMFTTVGECNNCLTSHYQWLLRSYHREFNCGT